MNYDPAMKIDARLALVRHAVMTEEAEAGRRRPLVVKAPRSGYKPPVVSADVRADYAFELLECAGRYMDAGCSQDEADALAQADLPCVEVWDLLRAYPQGVGDLRLSHGLRVAGYCSRCESVGHEDARCPFPEMKAGPGAKDALRVRQIAEARRTRRAKVKVA